MNRHDINKSDEQTPQYDQDQTRPGPNKTTDATSHMAVARHQDKLKHDVWVTHYLRQPGNRGKQQVTQHNRRTRNRRPKHTISSNRQQKQQRQHTKGCESAIADLHTRTKKQG